MALQLLLGVSGPPSLSVLALTWFLTYSLHGLLWASIAALLARFTRLASIRHTLFKLALFGPLLSAALSVAMPLHMPRRLAHVLHVREVTVLSLADAPASRPALEAHIAPAAAVQASANEAGRALTLLASVVFGAALLGLARIAAAGFSLGRRLRGRTEVRDPLLRARLAHVCERGRWVGQISLSESAALYSPLVLGRREICIPKQLSRALGEREIDSVFAHELAHLERRDGVWFPLVGLLQSVCWLSPVNAWLSTRFRETAELSCDDRAVELTGDALSLARALTHVAEAALPGRGLSMVPAMARASGALHARVQRLVDAPREARRAQGRRLWAVASLIGLGLLTVGLSIQLARARTPSTLERALASVQVGAAAAPPSAAPDASAVSAQLVELAQRELALQGELELTLQRLAPSESSEANADSEQAHQLATAQVLALEQDLRHVRATQRWLEERFVRAATISERERARPGLARR